MDRTLGHHDKRNLQAVNLALLANAGLAALKTAIGVLGHSLALLADGINSTSDVAYGIIVGWRKVHELEPARPGLSRGRRQYGQPEGYRIYVYSH